MQNAPSVTYPVGRSLVHAGLLAGVAGLGVLALGLLLWWWSPVSSLGLWLGGLAWLFWSALALAGWRRSLPGHLQWDAKAPAPLATPESGSGGWRWVRSGRDEPVTVDTVEWALDAQSFVLLKLRLPGRRHHWVWLEARRHPTRWDDLRRALTRHALRR